MTTKMPKMMATANLLLAYNPMLAHKARAMNLFLLLFNHHIQLQTILKLVPDH